MAGSIQWLNYKENEILFNDRHGLRDDSIIKNSDIAVKTIIESGKKDILYIVDNSDTIILPHVKDHIKKGGKEIAPYVKKTAVVGPSAAQKVLLNVLSALTGMNIKVFSDHESAKEWLIK